MKQIIKKTPEQIANIRTAGKHLTELLLLTYENAKPGITGVELEQHAQRYLDMYNLTGAFKGYHGFPANLCVSINDGIVHGIPDQTQLTAGDLVKIDAGVVYQGGIADSAISFIVGGPSSNPRGEQLIRATKASLDLGVKTISPGSSLYTYGEAVFNHLRKHNFSVIKQLTGHGVGTSVHEGPYIYNRPNATVKELTFEPGMVVALEPITAERSSDYTERPGNHRNLYTSKGDLGAQREYTVAITDDGVEILAGVTDLPRA